MSQFHKNLIHALQAATPPCWLGHRPSAGWAAFSSQEVQSGKASGIDLVIFWPSLGDLPIGLTPEGTAAWRSAVTDLLQNRRMRR